MFVPSTAYRPLWVLQVRLGPATMTIYGQLLSRGYFPKELPPAFFTEDFSAYARTVAGRAALANYAPAEGSTEPVRYGLAISGHKGLSVRSLAIPHPWAFALLARLTSKSFKRLLKKAASPFSKSRPVYGLGQPRAIRTMVSPPNLARERANARAGATHLLKVDVSQFYPSLYTHAVGWAIDPKLRLKKYWRDTRFLGKKVDQLLMDMQAKMSQGVPIGNDISFLLAELVLSQVDKELKVSATRAHRWFDDYEFACSSTSEAEDILQRLTKILDSYRLRLNPHKTRILALPQPSGDGWQDELRRLAKLSFASTGNMVSYFDQAFRLSVSSPGDPVLMYAIGALFRVRPPTPELQRVAQSCITQALLSEPGCAQKAFALLTFWELSGAKFDREVIAASVDRLVQLHESRGVTSDVTWALAFCIEHRLKLSRRTATSLSAVDDDSVAIQSLHARSLGLAPGFSLRLLSERLRDYGCDGGHWLVLYEAVRHNFIPALKAKIRANGLFADMLNKSVSFYRLNIPAYATLLHPGGAPDWVVRAWVDVRSRESVRGMADQPVTKLIDTDLEAVEAGEKTVSDLARELIDQLTEHPVEKWEEYF